MGLHLRRRHDRNKGFGGAFAGDRSSKVTARYPGLLTSGEIEAVRLVGPMDPATKRGRSVNELAASLAIRAP